MNNASEYILYGSGLDKILEENFICTKKKDIYIFAPDDNVIKEIKKKFLEDFIHFDLLNKNYIIYKTSDNVEVLKKLSLILRARDCYSGIRKDILKKYRPNRIELFLDEVNSHLNGESQKYLTKAEVAYAYFLIKYDDKIFKFTPEDIDLIREIYIHNDSNIDFKKFLLDVKKEMESYYGIG